MSLVKKRTKYIHAGFTVVEMLVVVTIVAIVSSVAYVTFQTSQKNARDQQRRSGLAQIRSALEIHFLRENKYPDENSSSECDSSIGGGVSSVNCNGGTKDWKGGCLAPIDSGDSDLCDLVSKGIIGKLPVDPTNNTTYFYHIEFDKVGEGSPVCAGISSSQTCRYILQAILENGERLDATRGQCIYSILGGGGQQGIPIAGGLTNLPTDCLGNIQPSTWSSPPIPCCKL